MVPQHICSALQWRAPGLSLNRGHLRQCRWPKCPFDSFAKCPFWLVRGWDSVEIEELPAPKCHNGRPGKPEHGVLSVKACHLSVIGGANRGHLPLEKVTYASVGPPCVSVIRVSLRLASVPPLCECHLHSRVAAARFARTEEGSAGEGNPESLSAL